MTEVTGQCLEANEWMPSNGARARFDQMLEALRHRLCLESPDSTLVLHETVLSRQFQVSRTPIRQVLQRLSYEQLVRTVSGIGTMIVPLDPALRAQHVRTYEGLLALQDESSGLTWVPSAADAGDSPIDAYFRVRANLAEAVIQGVRDSVLDASLSAAVWRDLRWSIHDFRGFSPAQQLEVMAIVQAPARSALECLQSLCQYHAAQWRLAHTSR